MDSHMDQMAHPRNIKFFTDKFYGDDGTGWDDVYGEYYGAEGVINNPYDVNAWSAAIATHKIGEGDKNLIVGE